MEVKKLLEVLTTAEHLKDVPRHCYTSGGRRESVAEHSWRLTLIADASAFAYLAKALGYKNVYVCTDGYRNDENSHGWAEINGRVYDPLFAEAKSYSRNYGVRYGVYPLSPVMRVKIA